MEEVGKNILNDLRCYYIKIIDNIVKLILRLFNVFYCIFRNVMNI